MTDPSKGQICAEQNATNVDPQDPNHSLSGGNLQSSSHMVNLFIAASWPNIFAVFGTFHPDEAAVARNYMSPGKYQNMGG